MERFRRCLPAAFCGLALLSTAACSTIVEGTSQTVTVSTNPAGAVCEMKRGGQTVAVVNPTPGSVMLEKSKDNVSVLCSKADHEDAGGALASEFQAMTFGNILFGGLIGVAIDAGSGAMNHYPASISLVLPPKAFPSENERDGFYDDVIATVRRDAAAAIEKVQRECSPDAGESCRNTVKAIEGRRDAEIESLNAKRKRARLLTS